MDWTERLPPRPWLVRGVVLLLIVSLLAPSAVSAMRYEEIEFKKGNIDQPANGTTVISIQGFHFQGEGDRKKPAHLIGVGPNGNVEWKHNGSRIGVQWFYDVDPLDNGNLLVTATRRQGTLVYEYDPEAGERVWSQRLEIHDTHDVDLINGNQLLVANMREYNASTGKNDDRLFIYDLDKDEIVWEWYFRDHYEPEEGGDYDDDWTHVNDVDKIGDGKFMASPRNMDEVVVVDRDSGEIETKLGEHGNHDILEKQHNPDYLESEDGTPTILVADSENHRIVEYERRGGDWKATWELGSSEQFNWPRDADRLPNGNTLVTDSSNHRVMEVTPRGEVVWEFYSPWLPYDAERVAYGGSSNGPTMADHGTTGKYDISGSAQLDPGTGDRIRMSVALANTFSGTPIEGDVRTLGEKWDQATPFIRPIWMNEYAFICAIFAILLLVGWVIGEGVYHRQRIYSGVRQRLA